MSFATLTSRAAETSRICSNLFAIGSVRFATYVTRQGASSHA
jgi:hypothetical protein